jgi:ketosteroid isomerase-like protein
MSQENVEIVRRGFELFVVGDLEAVAGLLSEEAEVPDAAGVAASDAAEGTRRGPQGFIDSSQAAFEAFEDYSVEALEFIDAGDAVVVPVRISGRGRASRVDVETHLTQVWTLCDGKIVRGEVYRTRDDALEAAGLRE